MTTNQPESSEQLLNSSERSIMDSTLNKKENAFQKEVQEFRKKRISKLRNINHWWNITLTVAGITLTAITTVLGVIDDKNHKDWIKFGIALSGSVAVLSQSANKEFRVKGKAGKYAMVEADLLIIEYKLNNPQDDEKLEKLREDFYAAIKYIGQIESESEQEK